MSYPNPKDYVRAVQNPAVAFADPALKAAKFAISPLFGVPMPASGTTAVVFRAEVHGEDQALRFFIREDASSRERYTALTRYVATAGLSANMANAQWADNGIRIGERWYPLVRMEWVEGRPLDKYVEHLVEHADLHSLANLAQTWRGLVRRMQDARFAHGDLQHGNVLVDDAGVLRLVDFDCSWIAPFQGQPAPTESGHRNYQRRDSSWGPWMDTFPGLVIYLSIFALSRNPRPWEVLYQEENLLFQQADFRNFDTAVWRQLAALRDPQVDTMAMRLQNCCKPGWTATVGLEDLLASREWPTSQYHWVNQLPQGAVNQSVPPCESTSTTLPPPPPKPTSRASAWQSPPRPTTPPPFHGGHSGQWWAPPPPPPPPPQPTPPAEKPTSTAANVGAALAIAFMIGMVVAIIATAAADYRHATTTFWIALVFSTGIAFLIALAARSRPK